MPLIGVDNGREVWPDDVDDDERVECPVCETKMHVRRSHKRAGGVFVVRHFVHNNGNSCGGAETPEHKLLKYAISRAFASLFPHAEVYKEKTVGERRADVLAEFSEPILPHGKGVIGEAQVKNEGKDIESVTQDYHRQGYSVYWVSLDSLNGLEIELPPVRNLWPSVVPKLNQWSGLTIGPKDVNKIEPARHPIDVKLPPDAIREDRDMLKLHWQRGAGQLEYDLIKPLKETNASRSCVSCGEDADVYLFKDGLVSEFRCKNHFELLADEREGRQ